MSAECGLFRSTSVSNVIIGRDGVLVHHLNCGSMCPIGIHGSESTTALGEEASFVCHCLLIETDAGLVLVDTGIGFQDTMHPGRLPLVLRAALRLHLDPNETAVRQLPQLGYSPHDVRHIIMTHLDFDHASGLDDFPNACVHVHAAELEAANHPSSLIARSRYRTFKAMREIEWSPLNAGGEPWFGFEAVRNLPGLPPEILVVPLPGHSAGHSGVAIETPSGWLLHAGDAYMHHAEVHGGAVPPSLMRYQSLMAVDSEARLANAARLAELHRNHSDRVTLISSHDIGEFETHEARTRERKRPRNRLANTQELRIAR